MTGDRQARRPAQAVADRRHLHARPWLSPLRLASDERAQFVREGFDVLGPAVELSRRVLEQRYSPRSVFPSRDEHLDGAQIRIEAELAGRHEPRDGVQHRSVVGNGSLVSDLPDISPRFVVREDRSQAPLDLLAPGHLAAVEPDDPAVFGEQRCVRGSVVPIPGVEERRVEIRDFRHRPVAQSLTVERDDDASGRATSSSPAKRCSSSRARNGHCGSGTSRTARRDEAQTIIGAGDARCVVLAFGTGSIGPSATQWTRLRSAMALASSRRGLTLTTLTIGSWSMSRRDTEMAGSRVSVHRFWRRVFQAHPAWEASYAAGV